MTIRFQADADFNQIIVNAIIRLKSELDIRTATSANLAGLKDLEVLALAATEGRVLLTHDHSTMPKHFAKFIQKVASPGVIVVPQSLQIRDVVDDLILIWTATQSDEWLNRIGYLPI
jgi:hypothetical protein